MELTVKQVIKAFEENEWKDTEIICPDGTKAVVAPCGWDIKRIEDCDFFLIYWDMPWGGEDKVEKLVETLNKHADLVAENEKDKAQLLQFFTDHQKIGWDDGSWSFYSDWHKDIFGYRPHGKVFGEYINPHRI